MLDMQIQILATAGKTPYEIEEALGIKHYTIHLLHHRALMTGYTKRYFGLKSDDKDYQKDYYARNREWISHKRRLARQRGKSQCSKLKEKTK